MVSDQIIGEVLLFGDSFLLGILLFVLYDVIRIFRRILPRGIVLVSVEDFLFWFFAGSAVFVLLYRENDGALRFYVLGGMLAGALLYYLCISRKFMPWITRKIAGIKKQLKKILGKVTIQKEKSEKN